MLNVLEEEMSVQKLNTFSQILVIHFYNIQIRLGKEQISHH